MKSDNHKTPLQKLKDIAFENPEVKAEYDRLKGAAGCVPYEKPDHPGIILNEEFLIPLGINRYILSKLTGIASNRILKLIKGERDFTVKTSALIGEALSMSPLFFVNAQNLHDLWIAFNVEGASKRNLGKVRRLKK